MIIFRFCLNPFKHDANGNKPLKDISSIKPDISILKPGNRTYFIILHNKLPIIIYQHLKYSQRIICFSIPPSKPCDKPRWCYKLLVSKYNKTTLSSSYMHRATSKIILVKIQYTKSLFLVVEKCCLLFGEHRICIMQRKGEAKCIECINKVFGNRL